MHEICKYMFVKELENGKDTSKEFKDITIRMEYVVAAIESNNYKDVLLEVYNEMIASKTYLSQKEIKNVIKFCNLKYNSVTEEAFKNIPNPSERTDLLVKLYKRRNEIAHQFDKSHVDAKQASITKKETDEYMEHITNLVHAIHSELTKP